MENEEILQFLSKIDKKLDKVLKINTTIAKALHLIPVSEKEEREIQLMQRKNASIMQKIEEEIAALEEKPTKNDAQLSINDLFDASQAEIYEDVIGKDFIS